MAAKVQQRNEVVSRRCREVLDIVRKAGLRAFLMKGQCNAALYKLRDERLELRGGSLKLRGFQSNSDLYKF